MKTHHYTTRHMDKNSLLWSVAHSDTRTLLVSVRGIKNPLQFG